MNDQTPPSPDQLQDLIRQLDANPELARRLGRRLIVAGRSMPPTTPAEKTAAKWFCLFCAGFLPAAACLGNLTWFIGLPILMPSVSLSQEFQDYPAYNHGVTWTLTAVTVLGGALAIWAKPKLDAAIQLMKLEDNQAK